MKKLLCVVTAFVVAIGVMSLSAEAAKGAGKGAGKGGNKAARQDGAAKGDKAVKGSPKQMIQTIQDAVAKLNLTDDQKTKITGFLDDARTKLKEIRTNDKGDKEKAKQDLQALSQTTRDNILGVLTDDQKVQLKEAMKEARASRNGATAPATAPATQPAA